MLINEKLDHGPVVAQASIEPKPWPPKASELEEVLAREGGKLLAEVIPGWSEGSIAPEAQDESKATYSKKISKEDGLIDMTGDPYENFKKIQAFNLWPGAYFFVKRGGKEVRVKITEATFANDKLVITRVIPEGKREMAYKDFLRG